MVRAHSIRGWCGIALWIVAASAASPSRSVGAETPATSYVQAIQGVWQFALDPEDAGIAGKWFARPLAKRIELPGALQAQGFGHEVSVDTQWTGEIVDRSWFTAPEYAKYREAAKVKIPFWLQPDKHYIGAAWYQRDVNLPAAWQGRRLVLTLERPHWETQVWLDGRPIGTNNSLSTPHVYDLGAAVPVGQHRLTVRVDNRLVVDVGVNSHSVSDHTQSNWNGIVGRMTLEAVEPVALDELRVYPRITPRSVRVEGTIVNATGKSGRGIVRIAVFPSDAADAGSIARQQVAVTWDEQGGSFKAECPLGPETPLWDEFQPALLELRAVLTGDAVPTAEKRVRFGLREISTRGTQFTLNGHNQFFRGTLECAIFPKTGYPPTDVAEWKRILGVCKTHGLNHIRFHSWCPPEAAFAAADELGFYFQVECGSWANTSTALGKDLPIDRWLYEEADRILAAYGNHPSFVLLTYGNEPAGEDRRYLAAWVENYKKKDPRRLYSSASGWPHIPENQFHVTPAPRIQGWGQGLRSRINAQPPETVTDYRDYVRARTVPVISHEIGQWCVYPNLAEIPKYTGYLKPKNFEIFQETLAAHHMADQARDFLLASGKLQTLCYKEEIESALRTPGMGGFQLLDLHDFPGQGTALVGVLDPFWESKGYVTADEYRRFCASTVPLARLAKRVFTLGETLRAEVEVAHFGPKPLAGCVAAWKLLDAEGKTVAAGKLPPRDVPIDNGVALGTLELPLEKFAAPARYRLVVGLEATEFENDWDIWLYPPKVETEPGPDVMVVDQLTPAARERLRAGGRVVLVASPSRIRGDAKGKPALGFSSIFWNTAWTRGQPPHTLGIFCDPRHPALAAFPTEFHSNWQWWYLVTRAQPMILDGLPAQLRPVVQVIDDWFTNRRMGLVFEAQVEGGRLLVSSVDLRKEGENPVARQLLHSLLAYAASEQFAPKIAVSPEQVASLFAEPSAVERLGAKIIKVDSFEPGYEAEKAIDGDPTTLWHTAYTPQPVGPPHELVLDFGRAVALGGVTVLPRQDGNPNGQIRRHELYASADGTDWGLVAQGEFAEGNSLKRVDFSRPFTARYLRLVAKTSAKNGPWACIAELDVVLAEKPQ